MTTPRKTSAPTADVSRESLHGLDHGHDTRADEMSEERADSSADRPADSWNRPSNLEAPEPRPGYTQRWVRRTMRGQDDPRNLNQRYREGWRPRNPDTLPDGWASRFGVMVLSGQIVMDDLVLCEMPIEVNAQRRDYYTNQTRRQMEAVEQELEQAQVPGRPIVRQHKTSVTHPRINGRRVAVADDN